LAGSSTDPFKPIGQRLAAARTAHGLTQRELADKLGRPHSYIDKLELAERRLDILDLRDLADALGLPPEDLLVRLLSETDA
jgi:transcriptional regulator with XRE-family HTH domain